MISCSSWRLSAKTLSPRALDKRVYDFCTEKDVKDPTAKLCHYYCCESSWFNSCSKECLIVEDLSDPLTHDKLSQAGLEVLNLDNIVK